MICHHVLVSDCQCLQDIFEVLSFMHHSLQETMFSFKCHGPNMHQGPKALNKGGVMLNAHIVMFRTKPKPRESLL